MSPSFADVSSAASSSTPIDADALLARLAAVEASHQAREQRIELHLFSRFEAPSQDTRREVAPPETREATPPKTSLQVRVKPILHGPGRIVRFCLNGPVECICPVIDIMIRL